MNASDVAERKTVLQAFMTWHRQSVGPDVLSLIWFALHREFSPLTKSIGHDRQFDRAAGQLWNDYIDWKYMHWQSIGPDWL